jgi:hypothetical protein
VPAVDAGTVPILIVGVATSGYLIFTAVAAIVSAVTR